ncbi:uncharacterized protein LOC125832861 [Solanum verrucosum]|uniref:uncharacterized protein LOC125832861 n=1 Tax=Solanum verrucosum TaxID=315347 RepID=UPI0020D1E258|nr:uncharacterized protein LOC125832861 [Solanum verrucosum]
MVNEGVPPQGDQGLQGEQVPLGNQGNEVLVVPLDMTNEEIRSAYLTLARAMMAQANRDVGTRVNANESTVALRLRDFVRMNPPIFLGSKVGEDPQEFLDEVYKIVDAMGVPYREKAELASYKLKEVAQVWFTQWKANRPVEAGPIEWEEFKSAFLVKEECSTAMLHGDMNISRLVVYAQSIEESKLNRVNRDLKRGRSDEQGQPRFKKRAPNKDSSSSLKANQERVGGSQVSKPTCHNCGKKYFGKCLAGTSGCYGCGKNDHQVKYCPTLTARGREAKQASLNGPNLDAPKKNRFYVLQANKDKGANPDEGTGKL